MKKEKKLDFIKVLQRVRRQYLNDEIADYACLTEVDRENR